MTGIYAIENKINHKIYIGQSIDIHTRFLGHLSCLKRKVHGNERLQRSWNKYGETNFKFYVIEECEKEELNFKETEWYKYYEQKLGHENVYNLGHTGMQKTMSEEQKAKISKAKQEFYKKYPDALIEMSKARSGEKNAMYGVRGSRHPMYGKHHTEETKQKLREYRLGTRQNEETKNKKSLKQSGINNPMYGKHHTEEAKQKLRKYRLGKKASKETCLKLSQILSGSIWINNGSKTKMIKPIYWKEYENKGWVKGRLKLNMKGANK